MKQTFTKLGGALFVLLFLATSSVKATITAKWDFKNNVPTGITSEAQVYRNYRLIESDQPGIFMLADATKDGSCCLRPNVDGYAQFNAGMRLRIPVVSTSDVITTLGHNAGYKGIIIGDVTYNNTSQYENSYTAKEADVSRGYVVVEALGDYLYSVKVELAYMPLATSIVRWDFKNMDPASMADLDVTATNTEIASNNPSISMTLKSGRFKFNSGDNGWFQSGTKLRIPVTSTSDVIKVYMYQAYNTTIGAESTDYSIQTPNYQATSADVANGYVDITFGGNGYIYAIVLTKGNIVSATIGSTGWATFSNASATDFTNLAGVVGAYQVTGNTGSAIDKSAVTTVAANTGLLLNAAAGTYAVPLATTGTNLSGTNKLVAGTGAAVNYNDGAGFNYVLAADGANAVFQHIVSGTNGSVVVPEGKAYLALNADPGARTLSFDDETTAISEMKIMRNVDNETFYDMQGRRVAQPAKGLYIVNGRKVIVK